MSGLPNPNCERARSVRSALAWLGRIKKSISAEYRGNPCHETASAPTTRYSTLFEFKHSINSRKSLLKGIGVGSLAKFEENVGPLLGGHLISAPRVGGIGFLEATEDADHFLHIFYFTYRPRARRNDRSPRPQEECFEMPSGDFSAAAT